MVAEEEAGSCREPIQKEDGFGHSEGTLQGACQGDLGEKMTWKWAIWGDAREQLHEEQQRVSNLSELHHHVRKHVQESHHGVPEAAVRQALLVPGAGALARRGAEGCSELQAGQRVRGGGEGLPRPAPEGGSYLDVLCEAVEHLFSDRHGLGKVPLALLFDDILAGVVPVEVADGLLGDRWGVKGCWGQPGPHSPPSRSHLGGLTSSPAAAGGSPPCR